MITLEQAKKLINIARNSISSFFNNEDYMPSKAILDEFNQKSGIFVSLYIDKMLIGCIGYPEPLLGLAEGVAKAAVGAAFEDPRFPPLKEKDFDKIRIELSVLTEPKEIHVKRPSEYVSNIKIGLDGLVIKDEFGAGLLLPQVAVERGWNVKEFLDNACRKAGLEPSCWNNMKRNVYKFQAQVFSEEKGILVEKKLA